MNNKLETSSINIVNNVLTDIRIGDTNTRQVYNLIPFYQCEFQKVHHP